jgi:hypothetical protein
VRKKKANDFESDFPELWFSDESLAALGMDDREVDDLRHTFEQYQLEIIATRNEAEANGLSTSSRSPSDRNLFYLPSQWWRI